jgi:cellobiose transport system permease protein
LGWGTQNSFGRAAAVAWILFVIILIIGMVNFVLTQRIAGTDSAKEEPAKPKKKVEAK